MGEKIIVKPVETKKDNKRFIEFPYTLYKKILKNPYWAAPLRIDEKNLMNRDKFPFYRHARMQQFLAFRGREVVGRIVGTIDEQYHKFREENVAYFGFFECINDREAAFALFDAALAWARANGMKRIIGPISPTTNHILSVLLNDFTGVPMIQVPYNPDYYPGLYDAYGFGKEKDHFAYIVRKGELPLSDKIRRVVELVRKRQKVVIEPVDLKQYTEYVKIAKELYNTTWSDNSDFVPWTAEEFDYMAKDLKMAIVPELTFLARIDGKPVGLSVTLRNFNEIFVKMNGRLLPFGIFRLLFGQKKIKSVRLAIMGVLPEYRSMGIDAAFTLETYDRGVAMGIETCEMSLILEDNYPLINMFEKWGSQAYRQYRVYCKDLTS
jgi:ribosomal protein S18 acetylase RimI-like enzyme